MRQFFFLINFTSFFTATSELYESIITIQKTQIYIQLAIRLVIKEHAENEKKKKQQAL